MSAMNPERWLRVIPLRLRSLFRRADVERELDDELRDHSMRDRSEHPPRHVSRRSARGGDEAIREDRLS